MSRAPTEDPKRQPPESQPAPEAAPKKRGTPTPTPEFAGARAARDIRKLDERIAARKTALDDAINDKRALIAGLDDAAATVAERILGAKLAREES